jgi:glycosyltransferase involved in cell wall biosynthesis
VRHDTPRGPAAARNAAIERARGEWIAFLDDDDLWAPGKLSTQLARAEAGGHGMSYTGRLEVDGDLKAMGHRQAAVAGDLARELLSNNVIGGPSCVILRRDLLERIGGFDQRLPPLEDWDLWIRAAAETSVDACGEVLIAYRFHPENLMTTAVERINRSFELLSEKHREAAAAAGVEFGSIWFERWAAGRELAANHRVRAARALLRSAVRAREPRDVARAVVALGGGRLERLARSAESRTVTPPDWLKRYA